MEKSIILISNKNSESCKKIKADFEKRKITSKYDMDRISRENLINMGGLQDNRSEFDKRLDKKESDNLTNEVDELIDRLTTAHSRL